MRLEATNKNVRGGAKLAPPLTGRVMILATCYLPLATFCLFLFNLIMLISSNG